MMAPLLGFLLKPKAEVIAEVDRFLDQFRGKRVIGIQMRTTEFYAEDNLLSIYGQCVELISDENEILFVSTDSIPARNMLIDLYGDRVVFYEDKIDMGQVQFLIIFCLKNILR